MLPHPTHQSVKQLSFVVDVVVHAAADAAADAAPAGDGISMA